MVRVRDDVEGTGGLVVFDQHTESSHQVPRDLPDSDARATALGLKAQHSNDHHLPGEVTPTSAVESRFQEFWLMREL
jgi:hypothetical protein